MSLEKCIIDNNGRVLAWAVGYSEEDLQKFLTKFSSSRVAYYDTETNEIIKELYD